MTTETTEPIVVDAVADPPFVPDEDSPFSVPDVPIVDATVDEDSPYTFEAETWLPPKKEAAPVVNPFAGIVEQKLAEGLPNEIAAVFQAAPEKLTEIRRQLQQVAGERATVQVRTQSLLDDEGTVREDIVKVRFRLIEKQHRSPKAKTPPDGSAEPAEGQKD